MNIFENLTLKIVSFVLAVIVWFLVVGEQKSEVRLTVPIELRNLPTDLEVVESLSQVEVTLRGASSFVKRLTPGDIEVYVDLNNVARGINSFVLTPDAIRVPVGASVARVSPSQIEVFLDATTTRLIPIEPLTRGAPAAGYIVSEVTAKPNVISVTGAQNAIKTIAKLETEALNVENAEKTITRRVNVKLPDKSLRIEKKEDESVEVTATIAPEMTSKFFENIPVRVEKTAKTLTVFPDTVTALIYGPKLQVSALTSRDIPVFINVSSLPAGASVVEPTFSLPETMSVKVAYPKTVTVTIEDTYK